MNKICKNCGAVTIRSEKPHMWTCYMLGEDLKFNSKWKLPWCDPMFSIDGHHSNKILKRMKKNCIKYQTFKLISKLKKM